MNERIKELAEQAGFLNKDEESIGYFAELIVKECARVCREQSNEYALEFDRENCASAIEEYFGVE